MTISPIYRALLCSPTIYRRDVVAERMSNPQSPIPNHIIERSRANPQSAIPNHIIQRSRANPQSSIPNHIIQRSRANALFLTSLTSPTICCNMVEG